MTHSPGPWFYRPREFDDGCIVRRADGQLVAEVITHQNLSKKEIERHRHDGTDPCEADARLIAAAPDLLEALEDTVDILKAAQNMEIDSEGMVTELLGEVNNALRKARGEA